MSHFFRKFSGIPLWRENPGDFFWSMLTYNATSPSFLNIFDETGFKWLPTWFHTLLHECKFVFSWEKKCWINPKNFRNHFKPVLSKNIGRVGKLKKKTVCTILGQMTSIFWHLVPKARAAPYWLYENLRSISSFFLFLFLIKNV